MKLIQFVLEYLNIFKVSKKLIYFLFLASKSFIRSFDKYGAVDFKTVAMISCPAWVRRSLTGGKLKAFVTPLSSLNGKFKSTQTWIDAFTTSGCYGEIEV